VPRWAAGGFTPTSRVPSGVIASGLTCPLSNVVNVARPLRADSPTAITAHINTRNPGIGPPPKVTVLIPPPGPGRALTPPPPPAPLTLSAHHPDLRPSRRTAHGPPSSPEEGPA